MLARALVIGAVVMALASSLALAAGSTQKHSGIALAAAYDPNQSYSYRILNKPTSSDERAIRTLGLQPKAQQLSNRIFAALLKVLGGQAPTLNFAPAASGGEAHLSAAPSTNTVNIDPYATEGLINAAAPTHSGAVNQIPHEMAHLRQVVTTVPDREGGAQAFADLVTPAAAAAAHTPYDSTLSFDGAYAAYVKAAQARGRDWIFGGQFGKPPVAWP